MNDNTIINRRSSERHMAALASVMTMLMLAGSNVGQSQEIPTAKHDTLAVPALHVGANGELAITASSTSSKHDFDFFVGKWKLHNRTLKKRPDNSRAWIEFESTQEMRIVLDGIGNVDNFLAERDGKPFEGLTLRLFNPTTRLWSIYWADSHSGVLGLPPVVGSFENNVGHFFSRDVINDKVVFTVYRWDARNPANPVWSQALSEDYGNTWEWNWYMYMSKIP